MILRALKEAGKSRYRWRLGAVLYAGGRVVASGHSALKHHPALNPETASIHAEMAAVKGG